MATGDALLKAERNLGAALPGPMRSPMNQLMSPLRTLGGLFMRLAGPLAIIGLIATALVVGFLRFKSTIMGLLAPLMDTLGAIWMELKYIWANIWSFAKPILELFGGAVIMGLILAFRALAFIVQHVLITPISIVAEVFGWLGSVIQSLGRAIVEVVQWIKDLIGMDTTTYQKERGYSRPDLALAGWKKFGPDAMKSVTEAAMKAKAAKEQEMLSGGFSERGKSVIDMRGSKIEIKQDFREADPDRVFMRMRDELEREVISRTQSGFASALTR